MLYKPIVKRPFIIVIGVAIRDYMACTDNASRLGIRRDSCHPERNQRGVSTSCSLSRAFR
jgi:hypothetical protein